MDMVKQLLKSAFLLTFALSPALAEELSLTIGNAVAGQNYATKSAVLVFRVNGCADLTKAAIAATAEGIVNGARRGMPLRLAPAQPAGVYAIGWQWGAEGKWLVAIKATCQNQTTGAIVPVTDRGFVRESIQMVPHAPAPAEIESALKAYTPAPAQ